MIKPDALPVATLSSRAVLSAPDLERLFGKGYKMRGTERVLVARSGGPDLQVPVRAGETSSLHLARLDRAGTGKAATVTGPKGTLTELPVVVPPRRLLLPRGLIKAWGLTPDDRVAVQLGSLILTDVVVTEGAKSVVHLDPADLAAAGVDAGANASLRRDVAPTRSVDDDSRPVLRKRLITENDVRQARLRGEVIEVQEGQIVTPAARSLGKELGVLR